VINGNVVGSGTDTFQLGGSGGGTFDLGTIGAGQQYRGFTTFNVVGAVWTVNNTYTQTDPWTVQAGALLVNGNLSSATILTVTGGRLGGTGTIGNTQINSGGTFAPGSGAPGTSITVAGNLAFQPSATYLNNLNPATASIANITGTAALAGGVLAVFAPGTYAKTSYDVLHAAGGLGGTKFSQPELEQSELHREPELHRDRRVPQFDRSDLGWRHPAQWRPAGRRRRDQQCRQWRRHAAARSRRPSWPHGQ
jgi:hypothetical protein